jgi:hypothetical protein
VVIRPVWLAQHVENGSVAFRIGRAGDELVAEWVGTLRLVVGEDGRDPRFFVEPTAEPLDVAKIKRGSARLLLRHLEGKIAMHGAAIGDAGRCVILLGRSGQGKSTLAAALCEHRDMTLFADDAIAIDREDGFVVAPLERDHWLDAGARRAVGRDQQSYQGKMPVRAPRVAETSARLVALIELTFAEVAAPRVVPIHDVSAMAALVPQVVRFVVDDPEVQRREIEALGELVAAVPAFRLERPRGLEHLEAAASLIVDLLRQGA